MSALGDTLSNTLSNTLGRYIPAIRQKPKIDRQEALGIVPVHNPLVKWERKGHEAVLIIPMRDDRLARLVKRFMKNLPDTRQIALDEVGSTVWESCNGKIDINGIVQIVSREYKLTRREAEASVTMFLQTLAKKNLIGLMSAGGKKSAKRKR